MRTWQGATGDSPYVPPRAHAVKRPPACRRTYLGSPSASAICTVCTVHVETVTIRRCRAERFVARILSASTKPYADPGRRNVPTCRPTRCVRRERDSFVSNVHRVTHADPSSTGARWLSTAARVAGHAPPAVGRRVRTRHRAVPTHQPVPGPSPTSPACGAGWRVPARAAATLAHVSLAAPPRRWPMWCRDRRRSRARSPACLRPRTAPSIPSLRTAGGGSTLRAPGAQRRLPVDPVTAGWAPCALRGLGRRTRCVDRGRSGDGHLGVSR